MDLLDEINSNFLKEAIAQNRNNKGLKKAVKACKQKAAYLFSQVQGFKSVLAWYHGTQGLSEECDKSLEELLDGYKRKIENLKATGKMDLQEEKNRLHFEGLSIIGKAAMYMKKTPSVLKTESSIEWL